MEYNLYSNLIQLTFIFLWNKIVFHLSSLANPVVSVASVPYGHGTIVTMHIGARLVWPVLDLALN